MIVRIPLEDLSQPDWTPLYVGDRARYATATSVRILDSRTLVCASLLGRRMYLIDFDLESARYEVLDSVPSMFRGQTTETDLCDVSRRWGSPEDKTIVVTSNCKLSSLSFYQIADDRITYLPQQDLQAHQPSYCHGARFFNLNVVAATLINDPLGVYFYDVESHAQTHYVPTDHLPKDVCFPAPGVAAIITTSSNPQTYTTQPGRTCEIVVVDLPSGQVLRRQSYGSGQFDSVSEHDGKLYVADSYRDQVLVVDAQSLAQVDQIDGLEFPHGVDVYQGMIAVTCYGDNAVHVRRL